MSYRDKEHANQLRKFVLRGARHTRANSTYVLGESELFAHLHNEINCVDIHSTLTKIPFNYIYKRIRSLDYRRL